MRFWTLAGTAGAVMATLSPLHAATTDVSGDGLREIVIEARRVSENQQRVPLAVTTLSGDQLEQDTVTRIDDLDESVPNLVVQSTPLGGEASPSFTIRGLSSAILTDPSVVSYFDEVATDPRNFAYQMFDLASVQVLKGPQGTLFGRNSTGGAILFAPQRPEAKLGGFGAFRYGRFNDYDLEGALNVAASGKVMFRVSGETERRDGTIESLSGGPAYNDRDHDAVRVQALFKAGQSFENYLAGSYYRVHQQNDPPTVTAVVQCPNPFVPQPEPECAYEQPLATFTGNPDIQQELAQQQAAGKDKSVNNQSQPFNVDVWSVTDIATFELGGVTLKNIIHSDYARYHTGLDFDGTTANLVNQDDRQKNHFFSEEFQIIGKGFGDRLNWILGAYYSDYRQNQDDVFLQFAEINPLNPVFDKAHQPQKSEAVFGQGTLALDQWAEGLSLTAGYRYTWDKRSLTDQRLESPANICGLMFLLGPQAGQPFPGVNLATCTRHLTARFHDDTYNVSLNWQVASNTLVYLATRKGYKSGGFNFTASDPNFTSYRPEELRDLELGFKSDWRLGNMPVRTNLAIYGAKYKNIQQQITEIDPGTGNLEALIVNQDPVTGLKNKAALHGGEAEITLLPCPDIVLTAFYGFTDSKYDQFTIDGLDLKGQDILGIAPQTIGATAVWSPNVGEWAKPSFIASFYNRKTLTTNDIDTSPPLKGYSTLDLRAELNQLFGAPMTLAFYGNNVTGERYQVFNLNIGVTTATQFAEPATYGVELRYRFGG